ncbi:MAG TPA: carbohydrate kinase family protein [Nocardioidaceae bacterium]|nr:carbohydrate kinase family protein [Nocardioidaceae bacterium]
MQVLPLVVVGELNADIVVSLDGPPTFGQDEQIVRSTEVVLGSSSAITACGAAKMDVPTSLVSVVGDDLLGRFLLQRLTAAAVDASPCRVEPQTPTGTSTILALANGERSILTAMGTIGLVTVADVPDALITPGAHVHVGSYFLQDGLRDDLGAFFADCRARGLTTSLDPNDDPHREWDSGLADVLPHTDVFFCNVDEALAIAGSDEVAAAEDWFAMRMHAGAELVVKHGADGAAVALIGDRAVAVRHNVAPSPSQDPLVDTVGAGDSLAAGYLAARLRGSAPERCLRVGVANGTASTRAVGGTAGQLSWEEAESVTSNPA